jgi:hypothetical protein
VTVSAVKEAGGLADRLKEFQQNMDQAFQGDHFHIRGGQLVDAIVFCHKYVQEHPLEKATVVVVTEPKYHRVTQAVVAYTVGKILRVTSSALGDISLDGLTAADVGYPEKVQKKIQDIRAAYLKFAAPFGPVPKGVVMAAMEQSGRFPNAGLYQGTSASMLDDTYHWLSDPEKAGLIPVSYSKVKVDVIHVDSAGKKSIKAAEQDAIVFDWGGVHYLYNDEDGTLAQPLPKNPVTEAPCLVLRDGDVLESLYFVALYSRQHPEEATAFVPPLDGRHAAAAFTHAGKLNMLSPFLGRFVVPPRYPIDNVAVLAKVHAALVAQQEKALAEKKLSRMPTSLPQEMPGDSDNEQLRRAYLAFKEIGVPAKFIEDKAGLSGLQVSFHGTDYTYFPPAAHAESALASFSVGEGNPPNSPP